MWSKNAIKCFYRHPINKSTIRTLCLSKNVQSGQVQTTATRVKEYTDTPKPPRQKVKKFKEPFPASFFVGKCDPEVLEYPEVLNLEEIEKIQQLQNQIKAIAHEIDSNAVEVSGTVHKNYLQNISQFQLNGAKFGLQYGGLNLTETETLLANEAVAFDGSLSKLVNEQQQVCGALLHRHGTEEQKEKFLKPLIFGEKFISGAYLEHMSIATLGEISEAVALPDGKGGFELTGPKKWVYNATNADAFIVFALTTAQNESGKYYQSLTAFIVPADSKGVIIHPPHEKYALKGVPVCEIELENVHVDSNLILGEPNKAFEMLLDVMSGKLNIAPVVIGLGKKILNDVTNHAIDNTFLGAPLFEIDGVKTRLGKIATALYALESAAFLQAGHSDLYENADEFLEMCILKVLSSETLKLILDEALQIVGADSQIRPEFQYFGRLLRDSAFYATCDESDINLKTTIAMKGLQHAGMTVHEEVRKMRNPLMVPSYIVKRIFEGTKRYGGSTGKSLGLAGYLHPSLEGEAKTLEYCISRIFMASETLLNQYGSEILEKHAELETLGDLTIATYTLLAALGRSSRSYCIGLSESTTEMEISYALSMETKSKIDTLLPLIMEGRLANSITKFNNISDRVLANKGCFTESPIARNF